MSAKPVEKQATLTAIFLMVAGMGLFTCVDSIVKLVSASLPKGQILIIFGIGTFFIFLGMLIKNQQPILQRDYLDRAVLLRIIGEVTGGTCLVIALANAPLSGVTIMLQTVPIIMTVLAILFLKEKLSTIRILAVLTGFAGAVLIIRPGGGADSYYLMFALFSAIGLALRDFSVRLAPPQISVPALSAIGALSVALAGCVYAALEAKFVIPSMSVVFLCVLMVGLAAIGLWCIARCMQLADISATSPFRYSRILFGVGMGYFLFNETIDIFIIIGSVLILSAGLTSWAIEIGFGKSDTKSVQKG